MKNLIKILLLVLISVQFSYSQVTEDWVQRFTSDSIRNEGVNDMFMDADGNVYVTGYQRDIPLTAQIQGVTVKYNSQGVQQWIQNYQAPANNGAFLRAVYVDEAGNVYVTGENAIFSGGSNEALIIKYNSTGTQLWSYRFQYVMNFYAGGFDIITDGDGNVYVTGEYGNGGNNIFLIKFSSSGNLINQTFYNSSSEGGRKIEMDGAGKIIVGGYLNDNDSLSFIALKYEQNLDFVWASRWGHNIGNTNTIDMTIDNNSNVILTGTDGDFVNYSTVKFSPSGILQWGKQYNSATGLDICRSVGHDNFGNIYVTGETGTLGFPTQFTMTTIKYDPNGNELWVNSYDGGTPGVTGYSGFNIFIGDSSNVYLTGNTSSGDIVTAKLNTSGVTQWGITYNGTGNGQDLSTAVIADNSGNVYTTGTSFGNGTGYDIVLIKYKPATIGIQNLSSEIPSGFTLSQNYPNPFNPSTKFRFDIMSSATGGVRRQMSDVSLIIYNSAGMEVQELLNESLSPGSYEVEWNAVDYPSGVYFYKMQAGSFAETKKMLLIK